jgi:hypothetical protein
MRLSISLHTFLKSPFRRFAVACYYVPTFFSSCSAAIFYVYLVRSCMYRVLRFLSYCTVHLYVTWWWPCRAETCSNNFNILIVTLYILIGFITSCTQAPRVLWSELWPISWRCNIEGTYNKPSETLMQQDAEIQYKEVVHTFICRAYRRKGLTKELCAIDFRI